jgi:serine/threonine-protein kinase
MSMRCPSCGTVFGAEAKFCTRDGSRLVPVAPAQSSAQAPPPPSPGGAWDGHAGSLGAAPPASPTASVSSSADARSAAPQVPQGAAPAARHSDLTGQVLDGRYRVVKKVGEGGMSFVYLAQDVTSETRYAIKLLSPSLSRDQNAMARLRREAGLGIRLEHPNICHIIRLGETRDGLVYVVMPFIEGEVLADRRHQRGQLPLDETVRFVRDIAEGLQLAHSLKIIHRDLKPENVMITKGPGGVERAVVMDFGLAKERRAGAELEKLTATGVVLGTPEFMSPEQLRGKPLDGRTDVYSLALMAYEMLTGRLPFMGRTQHELMINRLREEPVPIREMRPDLLFPGSVERVLQRGMARDAADRYQSAPAFAEALAEAAADGDTGFIGRLFKRG